MMMGGTMIMTGIEAAMDGMAITRVTTGIMEAITRPITGVTTRTIIPVIIPTTRRAARVHKVATTTTITTTGGNRKGRGRDEWHLVRPKPWQIATESTEDTDIIQ
jgi:hypothetical protein